MKALSIQQPWAWCIVNGHKPIENRGWRTSYRGTLLIHAGLKVDEAGYAWVGKHFPDIARTIPDEFTITRGAVVGAVDVVDCVERSESQWFRGPYGMVLANPRVAHPPVYRRGRLGFFEVPELVVWKSLTP